MVLAGNDTVPKYALCRVRGYVCPLNVNFEYESNPEIFPLITLLEL